MAADLRVMTPARSRRKLRQHLDLAIEYGRDLVDPTFAAAAQALVWFFAATRLPIPDILDSGTVITCVWRLDEPLTSDDWEKAARRLQRRCGHGFWPDAIGDLDHTGQLLVTGDDVDPRPARAVRPRRGW
jgi:hypothetical protein